jgi:hypothetical protein
VKEVITICGSGVALGVYVPALLVCRCLEQCGGTGDVVVIENLMDQEKKDKMVVNKKLFHENFRLALTGQKLSRSLRPLLDEGKVSELFHSWAGENRRHFVVFSGFWMPVLEEYREFAGIPELSVDVVHMDADYSVSWKPVRDISDKYDNYWLYNRDRETVEHRIPVGGHSPVPFQAREPRFAVHGGGWGMGTYQSVIPEMEAAGKKLDIVAYDRTELDFSRRDRRYFMTDPSWSPWLKNADGKHLFPPFSLVAEGVDTQFSERTDYHGFYDLARKDLAIISKPGGATLLDSLSSATPLIMTDPFGEYERKNAELWQLLGFGMTFEAWRDLSFSESCLETLHENLKAARNKLVVYGERGICGIAFENGMTENKS